MGGKNRIVGVQKWLNQEPSDQEMPLIKKHSYDYVISYAKKNGRDHKPMEMLPGFIELLGQ